MSSIEINESEFFEDNTLYIEGRILIETFNKIDTQFNSFNEIFNKSLSNKDKSQILSSLDVTSLKIQNIEDEIEGIIKKATNDLLNTKKKKIFTINNTIETHRDLSNSEYINSPNEKKSKKVNYLRNEAKVLEETISSIQLPSYHKIKAQKFKDCNLQSFHFFKTFCKKEVGKENNYIFNYRDNFLNDMTKIDQLFFKDYFKPISIPKSLENILVYNFSLYHPTKNIKTQEVSLLSIGYLSNLKDKIYCVLDEIQTTSQRTFFFIEGAFFNFVPKGAQGALAQPLSQEISENRIKKLTMKDLKIKKEIEKDENRKSKFAYNIENYANKLSIDFIEKNKYENLMMDDTPIECIPMRIGYPYLFRHIDSCDHMVILNDIRRIDKYDNFKIEEGEITKENVAMVTYQKKLKKRKCDACGFYYAKCISINDIVMGDASHALFLCDYCLKKLHEKDLNEKNLSNLKLIPYFHD